jgi:hypothetical protein
VSKAEKSNRRWSKDWSHRNDVHTVGRNASTTEPAKFIVILLKKKGVDVVLPAE